MAIYINMDKKFIRKGGRSAKSMPLAQLKELLSMALRPYDQDDSGWSEDNLEDYEEFHFTQMIHEAIVEEELPLFAKVRADIEKIQVDFENIILKEFVVTPTGVPAAHMIVGGDWEIPVTVYIYFDGKALRGYVPLYGNAYNKHCKCAFGSEGENENGGEYLGKPYVCSTDDITVNMFAESTQKFNQVNVPQKIVLTAQTYETFNWKEVDSNSSACMEDFTSRLTVTGPLSGEDFQKTMEKFERIGDKIIKKMEEEDEDFEPACVTSEEEYQEWLVLYRKAMSRTLVSEPLFHAADVQECNYLLRRSGEADIEVYPVPGNTQELNDEDFAAPFKYLKVVGPHTFRMTKPILYYNDIPMPKPVYDALNDLLSLLLLSTDEFRLGMEKDIAVVTTKEYLLRNQHLIHNFY